MDEHRSEVALVVDDSRVSRMMLSALLREQRPGLAIHEAADGAEAVARAAELRPDLVTLDINMPVMDGFEFLEANSRAPSPCAAKIALVTTEGNKERLARAEQLGVVDYLRKPFAPEELRALVTKWFEGR